MGFKFNKLQHKQIKKNIFNYSTIIPINSKSINYHGSQ